MSGDVHSYKESWVCFKLAFFLVFPIYHLMPFPIFGFIYSLFQRLKPSDSEGSSPNQPKALYKSYTVFIPTNPFRHHDDNVLELLIQGVSNVWLCILVAAFLGFLQSSRLPWGLLERNRKFTCFFMLWNHLVDLLCETNKNTMLLGE